MASVKLKFTKTTNVFGTAIHLSNRDKSITNLVVENLDFDPLKNNSTTVKTGPMFRSPNIDIADLAITLKTLANISDKFNLSVELDKKTEKMTALIQFKENSDAAVFGWSNIEVWQKWSDQKQAEENELKKQKPPKVKVSKDGKSISVTTTVVTLGK